MSPKEQTLLQLEWYREKAPKATFALSKKKMLIGSAENCDIQLQHPTVSSYHAFIIIDDDGGKIIDLESENGVFINNELTTSSYFTCNDQILLGDIQLFVEERFLDKTKKELTGEKLFDNPDNHVQQSQIRNNSQDVILTGRPSVEGLTLIDGEYCDIIFKEENHGPLKQNPLNQIAVDYTEGHEQELETFLGEKDDTQDQFKNPIEENPNDHDAIEVSVFSMGILIDHIVSPVKNGEYLFSESKEDKRRIQLDFIPNNESEEQKAAYEVPFLRYKEGNYQILPISGMQLAQIPETEEGKDQEIIVQGTQTIEQGQTFVYRYGTIEVFVSPKKAPPQLAAPPLFQWDPRVKNISMKVYSGFLSLMLLLLFINTTEEVEKKKEMAVIYKPAKVKGEKNPQKTAPVTADKEKDQGVQKKEINRKKAKLAKSSPQKKKVKKKPQKVKKAAKKPQKVVKKKKAAPPKKKDFKIAATGKLNKLFKKNKVKVEARSDSSDSSSSTSSSSATSTSTTSANTSSNEIARLGSNARGSSKASAGARGLASKKGASSAYMEPKTVVLGSMDPDLLRKILREYLPQFRHCYQQELERQDKKLKGVLDLNFNIKGNGSVANIDIELRKASFSSRGVDCMGNVLKMIPFPKPKGGGIVEVKQPLNFFAQKNKI